MGRPFRSLMLKDNGAVSLGVSSMELFRPLRIAAVLTDTLSSNAFSLLKSKDFVSNEDTACLLPGLERCTKAYKRKRGHGHKGATRRI